MQALDETTDIELSSPQAAGIATIEFTHSGETDFASAAYSRSRQAPA